MTPFIPPTDPDSAADQRTPENLRRSNAMRYADDLVVDLGLCRTIADRFAETLAEAVAA